MAEIIASSTAAASAEITVTAGTPATVFLKSATDVIPKDAVALIQIKSAGATYTTLGELNSGTPARVIDGPGTYRIAKQAGGTAFGVDQS